MNSWRKALLSGGIGVVLVAATTAHALTQEEILAKLQVLYDAVAKVQAQIEQRSAGSGSAATSCLRLTSNVKFGMQDTTSVGPVTALQRFLKSTGDYTYPEITGYFGAVTRAALQSYQARSGIVSYGTPETTGYGAAGPRTRQAIEATSCRIAVVVPPPTPPPADAGSCTINNQKVMNGAYIQLYSVQSAPAGQSCISYSANRKCVDGAFSGSDTYKHSSCVSAIAKSCTFGSVTMSHGDERTFYEKAAVSSGDTCAAHSQSRKCADGTLSGSTSYSFTACADPKACTVDGATVADGRSRDFYFLQHVPAGELCSAYVLSRSCTNGALGGDATYKYASCAPIAAGSCTVDNVVLETGGSATFYSSTAAPAGKTCASIALARTCTNGTLSGAATFNRSTCNESLSCQLDNVTTAHASSTVFYSARLVGFGVTCASVSQLRTCTNAQLSGNEAYKYAGCTVAPPSSCTLDGKTVLTGSSDVFYKERTVPSGSICSAIARSCSNAVLSGDTAYQYAACEVSTTPPAPTTPQPCDRGSIVPYQAGCN